MKNGNNMLTHYTTLPVLLDMLLREKLTLSDPTKWEDQNDVKVIKEYKKRKKLNTLFAICFCTENETNLFWNTYANGKSGCCIEFNKDILLRSFRNGKGGRFILRHVQYERLKVLEKAVKNDPIPLKNFPFVKRHPYRGESEFRIIWEGNIDVEELEIKIDLSAVKRITFNQRMPERIFETTRQLILRILDKRYKDLKINRSTVLDNKRWISAFQRMPHQ